MVWGTIAYDSRSTLIVMRGSLTGNVTFMIFFDPYEGPFLNGLPRAIFHQVNARPQTARVSKDILRHFQTFPWPPHSPDLFPAEHVWDQLIRQMPSCHFIQPVVGCSRFVGSSASGQHKVSNQLNAGPCGGMYCCWRWSSALLKLPSICVFAHPVFV
ncbi:transposable element Tc1 transposase [Trichonephila clavipes]|nr:transposable element Tc1 transposase [Trichonephila clavipes]